MRPWWVIPGVWLWAPNGAAAQAASSDTILSIEQYLNLEQVTDPQISPDGSTILFTRRVINRMEDRWESSIHVINADGSKPRFLLKGSNARWSPDGTRILYTAGSQIFVRYMSGDGDGTQVTNLTGSPSNPSWSPDGKAIAFKMLVPKRQAWRIALPGRPEGARWTPEPRIIEKINFRSDPAGFLPEGNTHLFIVPAEGGAVRQVTRGDWNVGSRTGTGELSWMPDGRSILIDGLAAPDADTRYRESYIYAVDVATGHPRQIVTRKGAWRNPVSSPDGRSIAFVGSDWGLESYHAADLYVIGFDGSGMVNLSSSLDRDAGDLTWARDNSGIYFGADSHGARNLFFASVDGKVKAVTEGAHLLRDLSFSDTGTFAAVRSSAYEPGDLVRISLAAPKQIAELTHVNDAWLSRIKLGEQEEIWYPSTNGARIQGWIVKPPSFDPRKKYPLILDIHGGPHANWNFGFNFRFQYWAANNYIAFFPNHRGSSGYGSAFGNAIDSAHPGDIAFDDLMKGVDALLTQGYVDPDNLYVLGGSDGGTLSAWVVGHTDRFAAAACRYPIINWISFAGTSDITQWAYHRLRSAPWENPEKWLRNSPLMFAGNVKTPTIIMTGELDLRTPISQSEEFYQALKERNVPTALVRFANEHHGTTTMPSNFMRTQLYTLSWFQRWARKGAGGSSSNLR